jgi:hypothetical protein
MKKLLEWLRELSIIDKARRIIGGELLLVPIIHRTFWQASGQKGRGAG